MNYLERKNQALEKEIKQLREEKEINNRWQKRFGGFFISIFLGWRLKHSIRKLLVDLEKGKVKSRTLADVATYTLWRFTRIGLFVTLAAIIPSIILLTQAYLLKKQYTRLEQQTYLQEAERRGSLVFLFNNIMDKIDEELKDSSNVDRELSTQLIARITSLSRGLKPYKYLEDDEIIDAPLSPERGQLLVNLAQSELHPNTLFSIFRNGDFSYSDLKGANLHKAKLKQANLYGGDLSGVTFADGELIGGKLYHTNLSGVNFDSADLRGARINHGLLRGSNLAGADLRGADLSDAIFESLDFKTFQSLRFEYEESKSTHQAVQPSMENADLRKTTFYNNDLTKVILVGAKVKEPGWFHSLEDKNITGLGSLRSKYYIDDQDKRTDDGGTYYLIKEQ